jgi:hypothetical protein
MNQNMMIIDSWSTTLCSKVSCVLQGPLSATQILSPTITATTLLTSPLITTANLQAQQWSLPATPLTADQPCGAGQFWIAPVTGSVNQWRMCSNGALTNIGPPTGNAGELQYNNNGVPGPTTGMTWNPSTSYLNNPSGQIGASTINAATANLQTINSSGTINGNAINGTFTGNGASLTGLNPGNVTWPSATCTSAAQVYSPSINNCVAVGTAANPGGTNNQLQYNHSGVFGGVNGVTFDGNSGLVVTGTLAAGVTVSGGVPTIDARYSGYAGGLVADGATDNAAVIQAAYNALPSGGGQILLTCGTSLATACYWANPTAFTWATHAGGPVTIIIQGYLRIGTTIDIPPGVGQVNIQCKSGGATSSYQGAGDTCTLYQAPVTGTSNGTLGTAITPTYVGSGNPTASVPATCNSSITGAIYQDVAQTGAVYWTCASTTGSITGGTNALTVAASGGFLKGDTITIAGEAGSYQIASISGLTFTLATNPPSTVSGAAVAIATTYQGFTLTPVSGWAQGAVATVTPSSMNNISPGTVNALSIAGKGTGGTGIGIAETEVCDLASVSRTSNVVSATFPSTTGSITTGTNTLTVASGTGFSNGANISIIKAGVSAQPLNAIIVSGGGTTTFTLNANASNTVTTQPVSETCHIGAGAPITVAGVTDATFNGTHGNGVISGPWQIINPDYVKNTLQWKQTSAANSSSSGGTVTGLNNDNIESVLIADTTSTTFSARFYRPHSATAQYAIAALFLNPIGQANKIQDLQIHSVGPAIIDYQGYKTILSGVGMVTTSPCFGLLPSWGFDSTFSSFIFIQNSAINSGCFPWAARGSHLYNITYAGDGPFYVDNSVLLNGGIHLDHGANGAFIKNSICESCTQSMVSLDAQVYWSSVIAPIDITDSTFQDNFLGNTVCTVSSYYPNLSIGATVANPSFFNCLRNEYFQGALISTPIRNMQYDVNSPMGTYGVANGISTDAEVRGENAAMAPAVIPVSTANVTTNPANWAVGACTLLSSTALAPDGTSTAGSLGGASSSFVIGTQSGLTPAVGDIILYGSWVYTPTAGRVASLGQFGGPFLLDTANSTHFGIGNVNGVIDAHNNPLPTQFDLQLSNDWWHPIVGAAQVLFSDGTAAQSVRLQIGCNSSLTMSYWQPFLTYISASSGVSLAEAMRWRQQLMHGAVPPNWNKPGVAVTTAPLASVPTATSIAGTSGTALCSQGLQGTQKYVSCYLNAYAQTGAAQTFTFPTAFSTTPILLQSGGSCGTYNPTSTATILTLPANAAMTAETCNVIALGQ